MKNREIIETLVERKIMEGLTLQDLREILRSEYNFDFKESESIIRSIKSELKNITGSKFGLTKEEALNNIQLDLDLLNDMLAHCVNKKDINNILRIINLKSDILNYPDLLSDQLLGLQTDRKFTITLLPKKNDNNIIDDTD